MPVVGTCHSPSKRPDRNSRLPRSAIEAGTSRHAAPLVSSRLPRRGSALAHRHRAALLAGEGDQARRPTRRVALAVDRSRRSSPSEAVEPRHRLRSEAEVHRRCCCRSARRDTGSARRWVRRLDGHADAVRGRDEGDVDVRSCCKWLSRGECSACSPTPGPTTLCGNRYQDLCVYAARHRAEARSQNRSESRMDS